MNLDTLTTAQLIDLGKEYAERLGETAPSTYHTKTNAIARVTQLQARWDAVQAQTEQPAPAPVEPEVDLPPDHMSRAPAAIETAATDSPARSYDESPAHSAALVDTGTGRKGPRPSVVDLAMQDDEARRLYLGFEARRLAAEEQLEAAKALAAAAGVEPATARGQAWAALVETAGSEAELDALQALHWTKGNVDTLFAARAMQGARRLRAKLAS